MPLNNLAALLGRSHSSFPPRTEVVGAPLKVMLMKIAVAVIVQESLTVH